MKKRTKEVLGNVTEGFLDLLLGVAESFVISMDRKKVYQVAHGHFERELTIEKIRKHFDSLRRRGYIEVKKSEFGESIKFTNKAKLKMIDRISEDLERDGRYYFVSFDIPERLRRNRDMFRASIKRMGFVEVQKSLWVCDRNVGEFVELAAEEYKVADYIVYIVSDKTNINQALNMIINKTSHK